MLVTCGGQSSPPPKLDIAVKTGLPLFWGEDGISAVLGGGDQRAPFIVGLANQHNVHPIDLLDANFLTRTDVLILAQPRGLDGLEMVTLDHWVRKGGRLLVFADPALVWPSRLPLGDPRRAPTTNLLGPLFRHWGLTLEADKKRGELSEIDRQPVAVAAPGKWTKSGKDCNIAKGGFVADCRIGDGRIILVGDADVIDAQLWQTSGIDNLAALLNLIDRLAS